MGWVIILCILVFYQGFLYGKRAGIYRGVTSAFDYAIKMKFIRTSKDSKGNEIFHRYDEV